ncbi:MAG: hypothetical protein FWC78_05900 [Defluviitaleaceae bacterium]|nr:hypothetical protein [Defluviitaleaceae bacterium]
MKNTLIERKGLGLETFEREGLFKQGYDKLGRPYEKKIDTKGIYTKEEMLKSGERKITIKKKT